MESPPKESEARPAPSDRPGKGKKGKKFPKPVPQPGKFPVLINVDALIDRSVDGELDFDPTSFGDFANFVGQTIKVNDKNTLSDPTLCERDISAAVHLMASKAFAEEAVSIGMVMAQPIALTMREMNISLPTPVVTSVGSIGVVESADFRLVHKDPATLACQEIARSEILAKRESNGHYTIADHDIEQVTSSVPLVYCSIRGMVKVLRGLVATYSIWNAELKSKFPTWNIEVVKDSRTRVPAGDFPKPKEDEHFSSYYDNVKPMFDLLGLAKEDWLKLVAPFSDASSDRLRKILDIPEDGDTVADFMEWPSRFNLRYQQIVDPRLKKFQFERTPITQIDGVGSLAQTVEMVSKAELVTNVPGVTKEELSIANFHAFGKRPVLKQSFTAMGLNVGNARSSVVGKFKIS